MSSKKAIIFIIVAISIYLSLLTVALRSIAKEFAIQAQERVHNERIENLQHDDFHIDDNGGKGTGYGSIYRPTTITPVVTNSNTGEPIKQLATEMITEPTD